MENIITAKFLTQTTEIIDAMYRLGWDERNGGNFSYLLEQEELARYLDQNKVLRTIPLGFDATPLIGRSLIVTGTGKYFKNVLHHPEENLGIIRIGKDGKNADLLWGYSDGGRPTSELPAHLMTHIERLKADAQHRVVIHNHATNVIAMTFVHSLSEREFTRTLWQMCTECIVVFPDGVGVLPWMLCGNEEIGQATAHKMQTLRLVVWAHHGIFGTGCTPDEAFGLIETVEKAAEIYMKTVMMPRLQTITDRELQCLADAFHVTPRAGYLNL